MHSTERERLILEAVTATGFVSYRALEARLEASPATIRRDLSRLEGSGQLLRVHGGAKVPDRQRTSVSPGMSGTHFDQSIKQNLAAKRAIGKAAAALCQPGEGIMIDGGTTTLQMCPHLAGLDCQILTNSLHIANALLPQNGTRVLLPSGTVFREQNIVLAPAGEDSMPRFHAPKLFMGAATVGPQGIMQQDVILVAAERRFMDRAEKVILMVDSSKFSGPAGHVLCPLETVSVVVTDDGLPDDCAKYIEQAGAELIIAPR